MWHGEYRCRANNMWWRITSAPLAGTQYNMSRTQELSQDSGRYWLQFIHPRGSNKDGRTKTPNNFNYSRAVSNKYFHRKLIRINWFRKSGFHRNVARVSSLIRSFAMKFRGNGQ
eukprot:Gregarina_sp_Poly_1__3663@NODE_207_length_11414_cov_43_030493_g184_i0_p12_GENE_NODE_207_length_11414_cov_43_030493_g184_i0NODE_207_length_11414_cov_43_030493_g184_i0_p12_ORF_typecomplete_len114_score5_95Ig_2/PF13895_6/0_97Ig_2/PF13895_6/3_8e02Ig_2/PF13895_6/2_9e03_NODE_207_length_11414_cov_43_030493_g184_i01022310564